MSVTLAPPARVAALVGALVLTGLAALAFMLARGTIDGDSSSATPAPEARAARPGPTARAKAKTPAAVAKPTRVASGFPKPVDHALRYGNVVVVSVSIPGAAVDAVVRREARAAAATTHAKFVQLSAANEGAMEALLAKTGVLPAPAVVIVKRPGVVETVFSVTDAATIQQAVTQARR